MFALKTSPRPILGLLGVSSARRDGSTRTRRRPFPLNVERFEVRVVPATTISGVSLVAATSPLPIDPTSGIIPGVTLYGDNATLFSQNHQGEICATFHLNSNDPNATVPITLRSSVITVAGDPTNQTLLETVTGSVTTTLDAAHTTATLCIEVDDILCSQVDAYAGVPPTGVPTADNILAGAVFHPSFDSSGVETFTVDAVDLGNPDVQAHVANECKSANIGNVGLTIGFWKNHYANWQGYTPDTTLGSIFAGLDDSSYAPGLNPYSSLQNLTFAQALSLSGGPGLSDQAGLMVKQAVGALLNASNDQVGYPLTTGQIKVAINNALASENATTMGTLQGLYDTYNNVDISSITNPINNSKKN